MKLAYRILFILHAFVGVGAIGGGLMAIINPKTPGGITVDVLKNSPFKDFLIPGIILFTVIGLGNMAAALAVRFKIRLHGYISSVFGWALVIWIVVQCIMLNSIVHLHVIFFTIGLVEAGLAMGILFRQRMFPANLVMDLIDFIRKNNLKKSA